MSEHAMDPFGTPGFAWPGADGSSTTAPATTSSTGTALKGHVIHPDGSIDAAVIDLREPPTTRLRVERADNPFAHLSKPERMRLIIRVLCEIVAYGESEDRRSEHN